MIRFLSTPSARRATAGRCDSLHIVGISIHALREEGDHASITANIHFGTFLSTPSARRATQSAGAKVPAFFYISIHALREEGDAADLPEAGLPMISIHALREKGDCSSSQSISKSHYFYPRPPRGGRHRRAGGFNVQADFYPRPPRGGRPGQHGSSERDNHISIHALREEGDAGRHEAA